MIKPAKGWSSVNGDKQLFFPTVQEAQKHELTEMLRENGVEESGASIAQIILDKAQEVLAILKMMPRTTSSPTRPRKVRKDKGIPRKSNHQPDFVVGRETGDTEQ